MEQFKLAYKILLLGFLAVIFFVFLTTILQHKSAHLALILMVLFVVLVEIRVRIKGKSTLDALLVSHIGFGTALLLTLIFYHPWMAILSFVLFLGAAATGAPMILKRF